MHVAMEILFLALIITAALGEGSFSQISMTVMAVTLLFVFDGFKDHRENEQTEQRGDDDGINHGASSKGCFRSSTAPA